VIFIF